MECGLPIEKKLVVRKVIAKRVRWGYVLKWRFGITVEEYAERFKAQEGVCVLCRKPERIKGRRLAVDHDHKTNRVRGLLCFRCNTALGKAGDNPTLLRRMANYVEEAGESR